MAERYSKLNTMIHFHNQRAHYNHLLNPRRTIHFQETPKGNHYSMILGNDKASKEKERIRKSENKKILATLIQIKNGKNDEKLQNQKEKKKTLINEWKKQELEKEKQRHNSQWVDKMFKMRPTVGSIKEWNNHFEFHKSLQTKLSKFTQNEHYDPTPQLIQTFTSIPHTAQALKKTSKHKKRSKTRTIRLKQSIQNTIE